MKCGAGNFQLQLPPNVRLQGLLRGETWLCHVSPLNNPFGPGSLMPQSEMNRPAHLHERKIKENLNCRVVIHPAENILLSKTERDIIYISIFFYFGHRYFKDLTKGFATPLQGYPKVTVSDTH